MWGGGAYVCCCNLLQTSLPGAQRPNDNGLMGVWQLRYYGGLCVRAHACVCARA